MADEGDIVQTLTVEGISEAIAQLENYGGVVAKIFSRIGEVITDTGGAFESFGAAAGIALAAVGVAAAAAGGALYELAEGATEAVEGLVRLQAVTGDSIENLSTFKDAVQASGVDLGNLDQAMVRLGQRFATELPKIAQDMAELPLVLAKTSLAVEQASLAVERAADPIKHLGDAYNDFALKLEAADIAIDKAQKTVNEEVDNFASKLEKADLAIASTQSQLEKLNDSYQDLGKGVEKAAANVAKAQQALDDFNKKTAATAVETKDYALNISNAELALKKLQGTYTEGDKELEKQNQIKAAQLKLQEAQDKEAKDKAEEERKRAEEERQRQELQLRLQEAIAERERAIREERRTEEELEIKRKELALKLEEQQAAKKKALEDEEQKRQEQALKLEEAKAAKEKLIAEEEIRRRAEVSAAQEREIRIKEAAIKLAEAEAAAVKAAAENIQNLTRAYVAMANGQQVVIDKSVPVQKQLEGILAAVDGIVKKKIEWGQIAPDREAIERLLTTADLLKKIPDEQQRVGLEAQLMGRSFAASLALLDPARILAVEAAFKGMGIAIDDVDKNKMEHFKQSAGELGAVLTAIKTKLGEAASPIFARFWDAMAKAIEQTIPFWNALGKAIAQALAVAEPFFPAITFWLVKIAQGLGVVLLAATLLLAGFGVAFGVIAVGFQTVWDLAKAFIGYLTGSPDMVKSALDDLAKLWTDLARSMGIDWNKMIEYLKGKWNDFVQWTSDKAGAIKQVFVDAWNGMLDPIRNVINKIKGWILEAIEVAKQLWSYFSGGSGARLSAPSGTGMARGGVVAGRSGVDTNLAALTAGEFVVQAAAVQKFGVPFFSALNSGVPRFALGGLNTGALPSIAGGGVSAGSAGRALHLTIEGKTFGPMSVEDSTASALERFAVHSQLARIGRSQSWRK